MAQAMIDYQNKIEAQNFFGGSITSRENRHAETTEQFYRRPQHSAKPKFL